MNISVKYLEANGVMTETTHNLSLAAFAKHMAFAGLGIQRAPFHYFRFLAYYFELFQFWSLNPYHFSLPSPLANDPTEKNFLSNKIGRALADFLAKRLCSAKYTHCYEDAMVRFGFPRVGERPDFYCDTLTEQFAIEAKGFCRTTISEKEMSDHKTQSQQGPIPVTFSIASVSYDLYDAPKVKFYDPKNEGVKYHKIENLQLRNIYYNAILEMLNVFSFRSYQFDNTDYRLYQMFPNILTFDLLVHKDIVSKEWQSEGWKSDFEERPTYDELSYIDSDGIGVSLKH